MKQCPNCKCQVGSGIAVCPYCEAPLPPDEFYGNKRSKVRQASALDPRDLRNAQSAQVNQNNADLGWQTTPNARPTMPVRAGAELAATGPLYRNAPFSAGSYPINTVKTSGIPNAAGYNAAQDYGSYSCNETVPIYGYSYPYPVQNPNTYIVPQAPIYGSMYGGYPMQQEETSSVSYWLIAGLVVFIAFSVIELILLLVLMLT